MSHPCPAYRCRRTMPDHLLMCKQHWSQVPAHLRQAVWDAYAGGAGMGTPELLAAQSEAITAVNEKNAEATRG